MAYQANKPQAADLLSQSQADLLNNFSALDTCISVDHVALNDANQGKHKAVHLVNQTPAPAAPVTAAGECALYSVGSDLVFKTPSLGAAVDGINVFGTALKASTGWVKLPNGIIFEWGSSTTAGSVKTITCTKIVTIYSAQVSTTFAGDDNKFVHTTSFAANQLNVYSQKLAGSQAQPAVDFTYFIVGV